MIFREQGGRGRGCKHDMFDVQQGSTTATGLHALARADAGHPTAGACASRGRLQGAARGSRACGSARKGKMVDATPESTHRFHVPPQVSCLLGSHHFTYRDVSLHGKGADRQRRTLCLRLPQPSHELAAHSMQNRVQ